MKLKGKEPTWLLTVILAFHFTSIQVQADSDGLRVVSVGLGGSSRLSAADLLSGGKASGQQHRETRQTPVMTDEGRPMMLVSGPNLCEEDTDTQSFSTALLLSSPGPHAVLLLLHPEDQPAGQCDPVRQAQELLGDRVLQFCIVLLIQDQQEPLTAASREMIRACGGRFHIMSAAQPKPAALVAEIHKLVWLNDGRFYSTLNVTMQLQSEKLELLKRLKESDAELGKYELSSKTYNTLGMVGWSLVISLVAVFLSTKKNVKIIIFELTLAGLVILMASLRNALSPHIAIILNFSMCSTFVAAFIKHLPACKSGDEGEFIEFSFTIGLGVTLGSVASIRMFSDVFPACCAAVGVISGASAFLYLSFELKTIHLRELFLMFMFCAVAAELVVLCVIITTRLFGVMLTIILVTIGIIIAYNNPQPSVQEVVKELLPVLVGVSCGCVFLSSVVVILDILLSYLMVCIEFVVHSYLFYPAILFGCIALMGNSG